MSIGKKIIDYLMTEIGDTKHRYFPAEELVLNYDLFVVWNENNNDYFSLYLTLEPLERKTHNPEYNIADDITDKIQNIMSSKLTFKKESFILFIDNNVYLDNNMIYLLTMKFERILKKSIIKAFERPRMRRHVDQDIISMIQDAGEKGMSASEINQRTQMITKEERNTIIKDLLDNEIISLHFDSPNGRKKKIYKYE